IAANGGAARQSTISVASDPVSSTTQVITQAGINSPPTLTSIVPNLGNQGASVPVTLTGTNFIVGGPTTISTGNSGVSASNIVVNSTTSISATFTILANATLGTNNVTVTVNGVTSPVNPNATFTVNPSTPTLSSVTPSSGVQGTSVQVALTGTNFTAGAPTTISTGNSGVSASNIVVNSTTSISAPFTILANATLGTNNVTVTINGVTSPVSASATFTVNPSTPTL